MDGICSCEHPLYRSITRYLSCQKEAPKCDFKDGSSKGAKFISELCINQNPDRVRYSSGVRAKENAVACATGGASTARNSIFSGIWYSPVFAARFSGGAEVNAWDGSFLTCTAEVVSSLSLSTAK